MRHKLIVKYSIISGVVLLFTMTVFALFNIHTLRQAFLDIHLQDIENLGDAIVRTTRIGMLEDKRQEVYGMIHEVSKQEDIHSIRLINNRGIITFSTNNREIGESFTQRGSLRNCNSCHEEEGSISGTFDHSRSEIFKDKDGLELLGISTVIPNDDKCSDATCHVHPPAHKMLGLLDVVISTDMVMSRIGDYKLNTIVETVFVILALFICLTMLTQKLITQPVEKLLEHTHTLARGEWSLIEGTPNDEIGELSDAFNEMTRNLRQAREDREHWAETLEKKVEERTREIRQIQSVLIRSEKLASLGELAAGVAHELNNPLTGILINAAMTAKDPSLSEELKEEMGVIIDEATRCSQIVTHLLNFSRESEPQRTLNSITETMERSLNLLEHHASFQDIRITKEYESGIPQILVDVGQMEQVFVNMLVNAAQAMPEGGDLFISINNDMDSNSLVVKVGDTGMGILEDHMEKIFDPFFSTKGTKGTGLGLSVSFGIIENHGGTIDVYSKIGEGTMFTIFLPVLFGDAV